MKKRLIIIIATVVASAALASVFAPGCSKTAGTAISDGKGFYFKECENNSNCGAGRYCNAEGFCAADCRDSKDCALFGSGMFCTINGQCKTQFVNKSCDKNSDCSEDGFCNKGLKYCAPYCVTQENCNESCKTGTQYADAACAAFCDNPNVADADKAGICDGDNCKKCFSDNRDKTQLDDTTCFNYRNKACNGYFKCTPTGLCERLDENDVCASHADCGPGRYCNKAMSPTGDNAETGLCAVFCSSRTDCANWCNGSEKCKEHCVEFNDPENKKYCKVPGENLTCTPFKQCLVKDYEEWTDAWKVTAEDVVITCKSDLDCLYQGFKYACNSDKICAIASDTLDLGDGPDTEPAHDFAGVWGALIVTSSITTGLPIIGTQNTYSWNVYLMKIKHMKGDKLIIEPKQCYLKLENFQDNDEPMDELGWMIVPPEYYNSVKVIPRYVTIKSSAVDTPFYSPDVVEIRGCNLADEWNDELPTIESIAQGDNRVYDQDGDGKPGMTTLMDGALRGEVYTVQRWISDLEGYVMAKDKVVGYSKQISKQEVIGASSPSLIYKTGTDMHKDNDRNYFKLLKMTEDTTCDDVMNLFNSPGSFLYPEHHCPECIKHLNKKK